MWELLVPMAKRMPLYVANQKEVPWALRPYVSGAFGTGAIKLDEIGHIYGGRAAKPTKPIMVYHPNSRVISFVVGGGEAEAAELEELAYAVTEQQERRPLAERTAEWRERKGRPPRDQARSLISEGLREHGRDKLRNPTNYPKREPADRRWVRKLPELTMDGMKEPWQ